MVLRVPRPFLELLLHLLPGPLAGQWPSLSTHPSGGLWPWHRAQARYEELADKRTEGRLTPAEQVELKSIVRANTLLGVLKTEAYAFLANAKPS